MGDFFLDFRHHDERRRAVQQAASLLSFCDATRICTLDQEAFSLVLSRVDGFDLWGPYEGILNGRTILIALAGRIALENAEWEAAREVEGSGGLACKAIFNSYRRLGDRALELLNGNYAVFLHQPETATFQIVTDRAGMYLVYGRDDSGEAPVLASHPDVLASVLGESRNWDMTSLAEFLTTGRLSFPSTYYRTIRGIETGCVHSVSLQNGSAARLTRRPYFRFEFKVNPRTTESDLAAELATAFRSAVRRRSWPLFGRTAVALSGGLDSRAVLAATGGGNHIGAFSLYDEENSELRVAGAIAKTCGVEWTKIRRDPDYYGKSAELGTRISGGTGNLSSNHFLGAREKLADLGFQNLLTGCHCDYVLKGLALNKSERRASRLDGIDPFQLEFYRPCFWPDTPYRGQVEDRLRATFSERPGTVLSDESWLEVERKRTFPLAYEADLAQRVVPQRVIPWYPLMVDNDILRVYLQTPSRFKLNASVFSKMVGLLCGKELCRIPDSNTEAPVNASWAQYVLHRYLSALKNKASNALPRLASRGSWPNWEYYITHSALISQLWGGKSPAARDVFCEILGWDPFERDIRRYHGREAELFLRLLTQKIWLDQRG